MVKGLILTIILVVLLLIISTFTTLMLSENKIEKSLTCTSSSNFASSQHETGNDRCNFQDKRCLISERQVKLTRYLDESNSQTYIVDVNYEKMGCDEKYADYDEKSEVVSGDDPDLFVNIEFNTICCG